MSIKFLMSQTCIGCTSQLKKFKHGLYRCPICRTRYQMMRDGTLKKLVPRPDSPTHAFLQKKHTRERRRSRLGKRGQGKRT